MCMATPEAPAAIIVLGSKLLFKNDPSLLATAGLIN